ncbi:MAG: LamG-like jellyroll fold domain-containing protein [Planctomycetota bacterium]
MGKTRTTRRSAFTLVEILVVCSLLAIIMGLGAAFLGSLNRVMAVQAEKGRLDALVRQAHNSASLEHARAWVILDPNRNTVEVKAMTVVGLWHFEDEDLTGFPQDQDVSLGSARLSNPEIVSGKIGRCLVFDGKGSGADLGTNHLFESKYGIAVEAWVFPEEDATATLFSLGKGLKLTLSGEFLEGSVLGVGSVDNSWSTKKSRSKKNQLTVPVPIRRWSQIAISFDGHRVELRVNGALAGEYPPRDTKKKKKKSKSRSKTPVEDALLFQPDPDSHLIIGRNFQGMIDEVRVSAVVHTKVQTLDANVAIDPKRSTDLVVHFAPGGWLDEAFHTETVRIVLTSKTDQNKVEVLEISRLGTIR